MTLKSQLFRGDPKLEACLVQDAAHITQGAIGAHVSKIQAALIRLDSADIASGEEANSSYGPSTANAVLEYKQARNVINRSYQTQADNIVGKMTIKKMDDELDELEKAEKQVIIKNAFEASRQSLRVVLPILDGLTVFIDLVAGLQAGPIKTVLLGLLNATQARNIAVLSTRLLVPRDPLSPLFRDALRKARDIIQQNLNDSSNIIDQGNIGRCNPNQFNPPGVPFAATQRTDPDPRVSVCTPFFAAYLIGA